MIIWNRLIDFLRECLKEGEYVEIKTPTMMSQRALGALRPLVPLPRKYVHIANRREGICDQADELPGLHALLQNGDPQLSGAPDADRRDRPRPPL